MSCPARSAMSLDTPAAACRVSHSFHAQRKANDAVAFLTRFVPVLRESDRPLFGRKRKTRGPARQG